MLRLFPHLLISSADTLVGAGVNAEGNVGTSAGKATAVSEPQSAASWDMRFIQHCGYRSHFDYLARDSSWPLPAGLTTDQLAQYGLEHGLLRTEPEPGDIFLQFSPPSKAFVHAGIVVLVLDAARYDARTPYFDVYTIEGDVKGDEQGATGRVMRVKRRLLPAMGDRFLRWTAIEREDDALHEEQLARILSRSDS